MPSLLGLQVCAQRDAVVGVGVDVMCTADEDHIRNGIGGAPRPATRGFGKHRIGLGPRNEFHPVRRFGDKGIVRRLR